MSRRLHPVCMIVCALGSAAAADPLTIDNGVTGTGRVEISVDDYGAYGRALGPSAGDGFQPVAASLAPATWLAGAYMFITTPDDGLQTAVLLTDARPWIDIVEPGALTDGIVGDHPLARMVVTPNTLQASNEVSSLYHVFDVNTDMLHIDVEMRQHLELDPETGSTRFEQVFTIHDYSQFATDLILHVHWDPDLVWSGGDALDDIAGVGAQLCPIYVREPTGGADRAVTLGDGGSSAPVRYYYAGKAGVTPGQGGPSYTASTQDVFAARGMPASWRRHLANVGYNLAGESGATPGGSAALGLEYAFRLDIGEVETISIWRTYGATSISCAPNFGCGDGYINAAAGETCEEGADDTPTCNAGTCTAPSCGDGYTNLAAGEECEGAGLCDPATCLLSYSIGGGCDGCSSSDGTSTATWILALVVAASLRRARPRSTTRR